MKQRILITGATGFLGSNLLERLREDSGLAVFAKKFDLTNAKTLIHN
jgi:nucleoside-diphosphate-sugar epimerase